MQTPLWTPDPKLIPSTHMGRFMTMLSEKYQIALDDYAALYAWSIKNPAAFWQAVWDYCEIDSSEAYTQVVTDLDKMPGAHWFPGAKLNFAQNLLRYQDDRLALIAKRETGERVQLTYAELYQAVAACAAALKSLDLMPGDRVAGYLPNMAETIIAMLATTSLGAIWSSSSPDFGVAGLVDRFGQIQPKVLFTVDGYTYKGNSISIIENVRQITQQMKSLQKVVVIPYLERVPHLPPDLDHAVLYPSFVDNTQMHITFAQMPFEHPVYIMFSSGTTGKPKCIVHGAGGTLIQHLKELMLHTDLHRNDRLLFMTTCGWMMWNWMVSGLAVGATLVLYEGAPFYPHPERMFDLIDEESINVFGTSAKYLMAVQKAQCHPKNTHHFKALHTLLTTGSPLAPSSFDFVYNDIKAEVCLSSISGGTDIISCFALGVPIAPVYRGQLQGPGLGMAVDFVDEQGQPVVQAKGELVCTMAFPSMPLYFWNDVSGQRYHNAYFATYPHMWAHGDYGEYTKEGGIIIHGRSDAVLNPGGVRIGTAEIYRQVELLDEVVESLAVGQAWQGDQRIILFVQLRAGIVLDNRLIQTIKQTISQQTTPRHVPAKVIAVADIPRTMNGKICERAVTHIIHHQPIDNIEAIANPEALALYEHIAELETE